LNVIEGKYPEKPGPRIGFSDNPEEVVFIPGNEGLAIVEAVGPREPKLKVGDWVVMHRAQSGTWAQRRVVDRVDVIALDGEARKVGREAASMLMVSHGGSVEGMKLTYM
jgi:trans-2-enoyl-CoA reductase